MLGPSDEQIVGKWWNMRADAVVELRQWEYDEMKAEIERLTAALKPFADLADRTEYTLDDVPHGLFIDAKLALRGCVTETAEISQKAWDQLKPVADGERARKG